MFAKWYYSVLLLVMYAGVFLVWKILPSRIGFLLVGGAAIMTLVAGMVWAARHRYFVNRVDFCLHAYVIADLVLETLSFEGLAMAFQAASRGLEAQFHDNNSYVFCTTAFVVLVGGYRAYALRRAARQDQEPASNSARGAREEAATPAGV